jgi:hypothetical protein
MVERAIVSTITIPVAAESPPMKTSSPSPFWPLESGRVSTYVSGSTGVPAKWSIPPKAIAGTKKLMTSM